MTKPTIFPDLDIEELTALLGDVSVEELTKEVELLKNIKSLSLPSFKQKLEDLCGDYRLQLEGSSVVLVDDETDEEIKLPTNVKDRFLSIHEDPTHWINTWCDLSAKELVLLLYKFPEKTIV